MFFVNSSCFYCRWLFLFCLGLSVQVFGQVSVASLVQAPLLLHPGLAGNVGKHRVAALANANDYYVPLANEPQPSLALSEKMGSQTVFQHARNYYLSYDQMWKAKGWGIGGFASATTVPSQTNSTNPLRKEFSRYEMQEYAVGIVVSPKLVMTHPVIREQVQYTIAPSLMLAYKGGSHASEMNIPLDNFYSFKQNHIRKALNVHQLSTQIGAIVNSKRLYVGYNLSLVYDFTTEKNAVHYDTLQLDFKRNLHYTALQHSACLGLVFPKQEGSKFSFSPVTSIGVSHSLFGNNKESLYLAYLQNGYNWLGYLHQSLNFRIRKVLLGVSYTEYQNQRLHAYHVGLKLKFVRMLLYCSWNDETTRKMEASINLML